jgi:hypothetical protein
MRLTASWCNQDIFFLTDALRRGMSFAEVAGFLARDVGEVRDKAEHLGIKVSHSPIKAAGQVRRLLDIFTGATSFESCVLRPTWASYS